MGDVAAMALNSSNPVARFFGGSPLWVLVRLVLLSLVVGVLMAVLGLDAFALLHGAERLIRGLFSQGWDAVRRVGDYILLGAVVVVPVWLVLRLARMGDRR